MIVLMSNLSVFAGETKGDMVNRETGDEVMVNGEMGEDGDGETGEEKNDNYICQYCDREFDVSSSLVQHEMQHLIGNNFEVRFRGSSITH